MLSLNASSSLARKTCKSKILCMNKIYNTFKYSVAFTVLGLKRVVLSRSMNLKNDCQ